MAVIVKKIPLGIASWSFADLGCTDLANSSTTGVVTACGKEGIATGPGISASGAFAGCASMTFASTLAAMFPQIEDSPPLVEVLVGPLCFFGLSIFGGPNTAELIGVRLERVSNPGVDFLDFGQTSGPFTNGQSGLVARASADVPGWLTWTEPIRLVLSVEVNGPGPGPALVFGLVANLFFAIDVLLEDTMLYVGDVPLMIPTEGAEQILNALRSSLCAGCPAGVGAGDPAATPPPLGELTLVLNTNAVDPTAGLSFGDLAPTDDAGGAPVVINDETPPDYCIAGFEGPAIGGDGYWRLVVDQQIFTSAGGATTPPVITGVALVIDGTTLLAYGPLPNGPANFEAGDIVKVSAQMPLRPQLLEE